MDTLKYELTDHANSLAKYDFFLKNMGVEQSLLELAKNAVHASGHAKILTLAVGKRVH